MDISKSITYRGLDLNGASLETGRVLRGLTVESVDYSNIEVDGYTEKRAGSDGLHASDVYLGGRSIDMSGHIYSPTLAELFDFLHTLRAVMSPTSAYQESPGDRGFLPLSYFQPTTDEGSFPGVVGPPSLDPGIVPLYINARPRTPVRFTIVRDRLTNGKPARPTAITWGVQMLAKDPRVYVANISAPGAASQIVDISGAPSAVLNGTAINRGDYETPLNVMLVIGATAPPVGSFNIPSGFGGIDMSIKIEAVANVIYRWFGDDRVLMTQDVTGGVTSRPFVLRMDLVTFNTKNRKPMVPASISPPTRPFSTAFTYQRVASTLASGSRLFWSEAFA